MKSSYRVECLLSNCNSILALFLAHIACPEADREMDPQSDADKVHYMLLELANELQMSHAC